MRGARGDERSFRSTVDDVHLCASSARLELERPCRGASSRGERSARPSSPRSASRPWRWRRRRASSTEAGRASFLNCALDGTAHCHLRVRDRAAAVAPLQLRRERRLGQSCTSVFLTDSCKSGICFHAPKSLCAPSLRDATSSTHRLKAVSLTVRDLVPPGGKGKGAAAQQAAAASARSGASFVHPHFTMLGSWILAAAALLIFAVRAIHSSRC